MNCQSQMEFDGANCKAWKECKCPCCSVISKQRETAEEMQQIKSLARSSVIQRILSHDKKYNWT